MEKNVLIEIYWKFCALYKDAVEMEWDGNDDLAVKHACFLLKQGIKVLEKEINKEPESQLLLRTKLLSL